MLRARREREREINYFCPLPTGRVYGSGWAGNRRHKSGSHSYPNSQLPECEHLAAVSVIFIFKHVVNAFFFFCKLVPKCFPCKPAVTSCLTKETELCSTAGGKIVLDLTNIVLESHFQGHYLFYFIFALSTQLKTNSHFKMLLCCKYIIS